MTEKKKGHTPPKPVQKAAQQALDWLEDGTRTWGTEVGHKRAKQLAKGKELSDKDVKAMHAYFARHEKSPGEREKKGWGDTTKPSKGFAAWQGWGGDAGKKWADKIAGG